MNMALQKKMGKSGKSVVLFGWLGNQSYQDKGDTIFWICEWYRIDVAGAEGGIEFDVIRVMDEQKQQCSLKNKGKYEIGYAWVTKKTM